MMTIPPSTIFEGKLWVHYGQAYVLSPECDMLVPEDAFNGQSNGLCGSAVAGGLFLVTGLHTGFVKLLVQMHYTSPPLDESWDEVVETAWRLAAGPVVIQDWDAQKVCDVPLQGGSYRVRYSARRFGEAPEGDEETGQAPIESYSLIFWPAPPAPDAVLRQSSEKAGYWNCGGWTTMRK